MTGWLFGEWMARLTDSVRRVKKEQLPRVWARLQPVAHDLLRRAGETADATYADFVWAFSIFWCGMGRCHNSHAFYCAAAGGSTSSSNRGQEGRNSGERPPAQPSVWSI
jgi:hypothetical protein